MLAADIVDTDYAQLLVGVARHECPGLLLGAHGVAPSKSSLARRVARVLDGASPRGPVARPFAVGVFVGAVVIAAPLAALTLTPRSEPAKTSAAKLAAGQHVDTNAPYYQGSDSPQDIPHLLAEGVSTSVAGAVAAIRPSVAVEPNGSDFETIGPNGASVTSHNGTMVARAPSGATVTVFAVDAQGRRKVVARAPNGATTVTYADDDDDIPGFVGCRSARTTMPCRMRLQ